MRAKWQWAGQICHSTFRTHRAENGPAEAHVRIGWLRSVANVYHAFAIQSFIDELAHEASRDPVEYWLAALGEPREIDLPKQGVKYPNYSKPLAQYPIDTGRLAARGRTGSGEIGLGEQEGREWPGTGVCRAPQLSDLCRSGGRSRN